MVDALIVSDAESCGPLVAAAAHALGAEAGIAVLEPPPPEAAAAEAVAAALARAVEAERTVALVLTVAGPWGDEVAARTAASTQAACSLAVSDVARDDDSGWTWTTATHGGALQASCRCRGLLVASLEREPGPNPGDAGHRAGVTPLAVTAGDARTRVVSRTADSGSVPLPTAGRIVAGGRGLGGPEGFVELAQLAEAIGAEIAASRPPCDAGWISSSRQVGITGSKVSAGLYVAVGISGSVQHLAGIRSAGTVVAVNADTDAPIFGRADLGVVGDWREVVRDMRRALNGGGT